MKMAAPKRRETPRAIAGLLPSAKRRDVTWGERIVPRVAQRLTKCIALAPRVPECVTKRDITNEAPAWQRAAATAVGRRELGRRRQRERAQERQPMLQTADSGQRDDGKEARRYGEVTPEHASANTTTAATTEIPPRRRASRKQSGPDERATSATATAAKATGPAEAGTTTTTTAAKATSARGAANERHGDGNCER